MPNWDEYVRSVMTDEEREAALKAHDEGVANGTIIVEVIPIEDGE